MGIEHFDNYLKDRYEGQVQWYESRSSRYKSYYHVFQWLAIILSSALPAVIVLAPEGGNLVSVVPSVLLAIVTSALKSFKLQENWVSYRTIAETLKKEKHFYDAEANGYSTVKTRSSSLWRELRLSFQERTQCG